MFEALLFYPVPLLILLLMLIMLILYLIQRFFTKSAMSGLLIHPFCFTLHHFSFFQFIVLNSSEIFRFKYFCAIICFFTKLLTIVTLFSTAVNAAVVTKQVILGILLFISVIFAFYSFF